MSVARTDAVQSYNEEISPFMVPRCLTNIPNIPILLKNFSGIHSCWGSLMVPDPPSSGSLPNPGGIPPSFRAPVVQLHYSVPNARPGGRKRGPNMTEWDGHHHPFAVAVLKSENKNKNKKTMPGVHKIAHKRTLKKMRYSIDLRMKKTSPKSIATLPNVWFQCRHGIPQKPV